jgi:uridine phosphorylase
MTQLITSEQVITIAREAGLKEEDLQLSGVAILTFNKAIIDRMEELCDLKDAEWLGPRHHPYAAPEIVKRGSYQGLDVMALVPVMGASPLACTIEDLIACGAKGIFLACASWSLGEPVKFGDIIIPAYAVGLDGTSVHYGNTMKRAEGDQVVVEALANAARERGATVHVGGNATCEAFYRITSQMVEGFREEGCFCMENGEASALFSVCKTLNVPGGTIFQPYIDLTEGVNPSRLGETYQATCRVQAEAVLDAALRLRERGVL